MKTKRQYNNILSQKTRKNYKTNQPRAAIIPHAGTYYAGEARKTALTLFKKQIVKKIIYISAIHDSTRLKPGIYELFKDSSFGNTPNLNKLNREEHSFRWVEKELRTFFPHADIYVVTPVKTYNNTAIHKWITNYIKKNKNSILLGTTDLTHHGSHYNNTTLEYPQRLHKQLSEENFINELVSTPINIKKIKAFLSNTKLLCGPYAIILFMNIIKQLGYGGKVTDYYDSNFDEKKLNKYTILHKSQDNFVSYVSIVYGNGIKQTQINNLDIMMALGGVKSEISKIVHQQHYNVRLPIWSPFYNLTQGVFVGTSIDNKTNCSYGRYETTAKEAEKWHLSASTADKIIDAAGDCIKDARDRWKLPYSEKDLDRLNYKIELLDPKKEWREYKGKNVKQHFKMNGKQGIYLQLKDNYHSFKNRSATYLPVVAREHKNWSVDEYMNSLTKKAGGKGDEWKEGKIWIYNSKSYTWDPKTQKIIVQ